ncbi:MAG: hypothetical protein CMF46_03085 [Legionellales bacterium]|nr:hypothetical protein [Legionellales bacterium]|tara:strand:+ start:363 stop:914 length:552 start_codon:yes stop_codon:yes gene_type:complete
MIKDTSLLSYWSTFKYKKLLSVCMIVLSCVAVYTYQAKQSAKRLDSLAINAMLAVIDNNNDYQNRLSNAQFLIKNQHKKFFSDLAKLYTAKQSYEQDDTQSAAAILLELSNSGTNTAVRDLAKIRLARIYYSESKQEHGDALLETISNASFKDITDLTRQIGDSDLSSESYAEMINMISSQRG